MKMSKTKVVNITHKKLYDVFIGRPSEWGNPFSVGKDGTREEVIAKHLQFLKDKIKKDSAFFERMKAELKGKVLGCYCKPKLCHGDNYVSILEDK